MSAIVISLFITSVFLFSLATWTADTTISIKFFTQGAITILCCVVVSGFIYIDEEE